MARDCDGGRAGWAGAGAFVARVFDASGGRATAAPEPTRKEKKDSPPRRRRHRTHLIRLAAPPCSRHTFYKWKVGPARARAPPRARARRRVRRRRRAKTGPSGKCDRYAAVSERPAETSSHVTEARGAPAWAARRRASRAPPSAPLASSATRRDDIPGSTSSPRFAARHPTHDDSFCKMQFSFGIQEGPSGGGIALSSPERGVCGRLRPQTAPPCSTPLGLSSMRRVTESVVCVAPMGVRQARLRWMGARSRLGAPWRHSDK